VVSHWGIMVEDTVQVDPIRKEFEEWAKDKFSNTDSDEHGDYNDDRTDSAWHGFQAAYELRQSEVNRLVNALKSAREAINYADFHVRNSNYDNQGIAMRNLVSSSLTIQQALARHRGYKNIGGSHDK